MRGRAIKNGQQRTGSYRQDYGSECERQTMACWMLAEPPTLQRAPIIAICGRNAPEIA